MGGTAWWEVLSGRWEGLSGMGDWVVGGAEWWEGLSGRDCMVGGAEW